MKGKFHKVYSGPGYPINEPVFGEAPHVISKSGEVVGVIAKILCVYYGQRPTEFGPKRFEMSFAE